MDIPLIPVAAAPPSLPTPQSPYSSLTSSRIILARRPDVSASEVGEWMANWEDWGLVVEGVLVDSHVVGSG